jgi:anti-sigma factor RsiW
MDTNDWTEQLERAFRGTLSEQEAAMLRDRIESDAAFREAAAQYRTLWRGFAELQESAFRARMTAWEAAETGVDQDELLEWYVTDQLSPENRERVAARISSDPATAAAYVQYQQLAKGFAQVQTEDFQDRLQTWEAQARTATPVRSIRRSFIRSVAAAAAVLVLLFVGANWYADAHYANGPMADQFVDAQQPVIDIVLGDNSPAGDPNRNFLVDFAEARQMLQKGEYEAALVAFTDLQTTLMDTDFSEKQITYYQDHLEWNHLLARLGSGDTGNDFDLRLKSIADNELHTCQEVAQELQAQLQSVWRQLAD